MVNYKPAGKAGFANSQEITLQENEWPNLLSLHRDIIYFAGNKAMRRQGVTDYLVATDEYFHITGVTIITDGSATTKCRLFTGATAGAATTLLATMHAPAVAGTYYFPLQVVTSTTQYITWNSSDATVAWAACYGVLMKVGT